MNPNTQEHWIIDYRIYDPQGDGKSKLDHLRNMLTNVMHHKYLAYRSVLMDTWYAPKELMLFIEVLGKICYSPLKRNHLFNNSGGALAYRHVDSLSWSEREAAHGKIIKIKGFPRDHKIKLFRVAPKHGLLDEFLTQQLKNPAIAMRIV